MDIKVIADCPWCGATNNENHVIAWGGDYNPNRHYIFECWRCKKGFVSFRGKVTHLKDFPDEP